APGEGFRNRCTHRLGKPSPLQERVSGGGRLSVHADAEARACGVTREQIAHAPLHHRRDAAVGDGARARGAVVAIDGIHTGVVGVFQRGERRHFVGDGDVVGRRGTFVGGAQLPDHTLTRCHLRGLHFGEAGVRRPVGAVGTAAVRVHAGTLEQTHLAEDHFGAVGGRGRRRGRRTAVHVGGR